MKHTRARAEEQFAAIQKQPARARTEHEIAQQERAEHIERLRALRLARSHTHKRDSLSAGHLIHLLETAGGRHGAF